MGNKIKLKFNDEHIKLIKALHTENLDLSEILKSFNGYDNKVIHLKFNDSTKQSQLGNYGCFETVSGCIKRVAEEHNCNIEDCFDETTVGDIMEKNHIHLDSLYGIDSFNPWGGTFIFEQVALILGIHDRVIPESLEDVTGPKYPEEDTEHMKELISFIQDNLQNIEEILHQFCTEGIKEGVTYWCFNYQHIWKIEE